MTKLSEELIERLDDQSRRYQSVILTLPEWADIRASLHPAMPSSEELITEIKAIVEHDAALGLKPPLHEHIRALLARLHPAGEAVAWWALVNPATGLLVEAHRDEASEPVAWRYLSKAKNAKWTVQKNKPAGPFVADCIVEGLVPATLLSSQDAEIERLTTALNKIAHASGTHAEVAFFAVGIARAAISPLPEGGNG